MQTVSPTFNTNMSIKIGAHIPVQVFGTEKRVRLTCEQALAQTKVLSACIPTPCPLNYFSLNMCLSALDEESVSKQLLPESLSFPPLNWQGPSPSCFGMPRFQAKLPSPEPHAGLPLFPGTWTTVYFCLHSCAYQVLKPHALCSSLDQAWGANLFISAH